MAIIHVLYIVTQGDAGGAQKYVREMAQAAKNAGHTVTVAVGQSEDRSLVQSLKQANIEIVELRHLVRPISPLHDVLAVFELWSVCRRLKPTVIHLNSSKTGVVGSVASLLAKITGRPHKLIYTVHGWAFMESGSLVKRLTYFVCEWLTAPLKNLIIFITQADREVARKNNFIIANAVQIPNGIDIALPHLSRNEARDRLGLPQDNLIIGTIANFYHTKGLGDFISVIKNIRQQHPMVMGVIIGDGPLRIELENQIQSSDLTSAVLLVGKKSNAQQYLKAFDLYLSTSHKEGFPYTILEAMNTQIPIVATRVGGIPDIIENNTHGLLAPTQNISEITLCVQTLINDLKLRETLAQNAVTKVSQQYQLKNSIEQTLRLYH
jgi:glycosyltransferase involved in cell wall biosynthesis